MPTSKLSIELPKIQSDHAQFHCVHHLFEEQVSLNPQAVAVICGDRYFTYRQINIRANQLAHYLHRIGVKPDVLVGIYTERSVEMLVGILAILKAGGAYVPVDPSYPLERQNFIIADTQLQILLAQDSLINRLSLDQLQIISLSPENSHIISMSEDNIDSGCNLDNLAYVMYTSGSTGKPKGVCITHRGVARLVKNTNYVKLTSEEVFLQLAPLTFDASTFEIWGCLLNGGKLVIAAPHTLSLEELGAIIQTQRVSTLWLTAGLFQLMVDQNIEALASLHQLLAGGDILSVPHVQKFLDRVPNCQLINGYGPTENTTFTCCYQITAPLNLEASIPIGYPITNTQVYILDEQLQPVTDNVAGELYIGGDGLARGYLNQPELTAEKFIDLLDTRLYQTGDLARYLSDGKIEFLGRIDNQVKIRGFRVELGEIERVLAQHPQVRENVVLARQDGHTEKKLIAYIVAGDRVCTSTALRSFLQQRLPDYMLPSAFVFLESLPLTPNGKVDRHQLPAPSRERPPLEQAYIAPQNDLQRLLVKIWTDLLGLDRVGINDNFFDLGGTSISILQVAGEIQQQLGMEVPVVKLFQYSTVGGLAGYLAAKPDLDESNKIKSRAQRQRSVLRRGRK